MVDEGGALKVTVHDVTGNRDLVIRPDLLVLSTGIAPAVSNPELSGLLRSALTGDGFFLEAHPKLRPVDLANEGEFIAGLAHSPRFIDETISQASPPSAGRPRCSPRPIWRSPDRWPTSSLRSASPAPPA